jgi:hypothetical protein
VWYQICLKHHFLTRNHHFWIHTHSNDFDFLDVFMDFDYNFIAFFLYLYIRRKCLSSDNLQCDDGKELIWEFFWWSVLVWRFSGECSVIFGIFGLLIQENSVFWDVNLADLTRIWQRGNETWFWFRCLDML